MLDEMLPDRRLIIADIPGLVEGAHTGYGLGHRFLKHVERTRFLVHIVSLEDVNLDDPFASFDLINGELAMFDPELATRKQIEVFNKIDIVDEEFVEAVRAKVKESGREIFFISAKTGAEVEPLVARMWQLQEELEQNAPIALFSRDKYAPVVEDEVDPDIIDNNDDDDDFSEIEVVYCRD